MKPRLAAVVTTALALPLLPLAVGGGPASAGPPASSELRISSTTANSQAEPRVAVDADGDQVVVWSSMLQDGSGYGVFSQRFTAAGAARGVETRVNTTIGSDQHEPGVAMDALGDYVVTWSSEGQDGSLSGVYAQRYSATGARLGLETRINTTTADAQREPSVAMDAAGDYVIAWSSVGQDGSLSGIYAQRYNTAGTKQGSETRVNTTTTSNQSTPAIAMDASGDYVVTWTSPGSQDGDGGIYAQRYNAAGTKQGPETLVNTTTTGEQREPSVAMDAGGDFVITWASPSQEVTSWGVYAQRYNAAGTRQGTEVHVNTNIPGDQRAPSIAMDADGDYVITWESTAQDGSGAGVYAQRYNAAGTRQGTESRLNTTTANDQREPSVGTDADGDYVVAWTSGLQDGSGDGVYARRFRGPDPVDLRLDQFDTADPVPVLGDVTYRMRVANLADATATTGSPVIDGAIGSATGVYVVSTIPDGATYSSSAGAGWTCVPATSTVRCRLSGVLAAGDTTPRLLLTYTMPSNADTLLHAARVFENQLDPTVANDSDPESTRVLCTLQLAEARTTTTEGGAVRLQVDRTGRDCGRASVDFHEVAGTATPNADYDEIADTLLFEDTDDLLTFEVATVTDALDERDEQFRVRLTDPVGALLGRQPVEAVTITDDDAPPRVNFATAGATGAEPGALVDVTVRLSSASGRPVTVDLAADGTATPGSDYFAPASITIPEGARSADFTIEVVDDGVAEVEETARLTLTAPVGATVGSLSTYQLTISSNE
jgi:hypothetical protein